MSRQRAFLESAQIAADLIADPRVELAWQEPSALPEMSIGALATHLGAQVGAAHAAAVDPSVASAEKPVTVLEHYARASWVGAELDDEANVRIREGAEQSALDGYAGLKARVEGSLAHLQPWPSSTNRVVRMPWWQWSLSLDDFLLTRAMELVVHTDDLAASLGVPTPEFPRTVTRPVFTLLVALAERRHGQSAVVRTLTRAERAPGSIVAF